MNRNERTEGMQAKLSTLWIFVMLNMIFADILSFMRHGFLQDVMAGKAGGVEITDGFLLLAAIITEIPIAMVFLSRILPYRANRLANIIAGVITALYVVGGGALTPHYIFIATMEILGCALIVWLAWKWTNPGS